MSVRPTGLRPACVRAAAAAIVVGCLFASVGVACTIGPVDLRKLNANSDVVVVGHVRVIEEREEVSGTAYITTGIAEIAPERVIRSRIARAHTYRFTYKEIDQDGCLVGLAPIDGERVKAWLRRSTEPRGDLEILYFEPAD
jgi:hypothetical protein